ncbi:gamma-glutamylcyclotransferase family protein [Metamycoplasma canadense]|uniref:Gamma-glutamylcyclotransferase AIG2-like domain-containing protein n=1 Tax=Metamycoplasma canadense TaxID=29554 RepID=A0A077L6Y3_9BACT|nr:gamma-glutamylcyclotransferase family protein [Metamycoplasma canadense]BAP39561.1 hypothetical protein MCAN360_0392 [Metamycoplasma canadense]
MNNKKDNKVYVFSYGTIQDELFYKNLLSPSTLRKKAILNGYAKCVDESNYFLLKKDIAYQVKGTLFEITKDELFMIDRWENFPQYQRFQANVILEDTNEIVEDVYVYTKLEFGQYYLADDNLGFSKSPYETEENLNAFIQKEKMTEFLPLLDNGILYEINQEELEKIKSLPHPYLALILDDKENKNYLVEPYTILAFSNNNNNKHYALLVTFAQKNNMNSIFYYHAFENKIENAKIDKFFKPFYDFSLDFLNNKTPIKYINIRRDLGIDEPKFGIFEDKAYEIILNDFDIDHFKRLDIMIKTLEDNIEQKHD